MTNDAAHANNTGALKSTDMLAPYQYHRYFQDILLKELWDHSGDEGVE